MQIDATTMSDLEVFGTPDGSDGLFQLIDRTCSELGHKALRRRVQNPMSDGAELRRTQHAVLFLMRRARPFRIEQWPLDGVDSYLRSRIEVRAAFPPAEPLRYCWLALRNREVLKELEEGVRQTVWLFRQLATVGESLGNDEPPELISGLITDLRHAARTVLEAHSNHASLLSVDRAYRGPLRETIEHALSAVAELDALNAMALSTAALGWTMPELVESESFLLHADGVFHPFLREPVPNPVRLSADKPMIFLTGPNMAGKTTYLRSVALVVLLAQLGMGVPAMKARLAPVEALFTSLNPSDNLKAGVSYFLAEVLRVKAAAGLLAEGRRALILFDEVFKGTNVKDALEASAEVILGFARACRSGFIFSSHLAELVDILSTDSRIQFCCFDADVVGGSPHFGYQLGRGASNRRLGLLLLEQQGIPKLLARIRG
jgi:DNA mismatch repair protein MutS